MDIFNKNYINIYLYVFICSYKVVNCGRHLNICIMTKYEYSYLL